MPEKIGFTGTQDGMTGLQQAAIERYMFTGVGRDTEAHHGLCIGADYQFHVMCCRYGVGRIIGHPPTKKDKVAPIPLEEFAELREEKSYLVRNVDIVIETQWLIATPKGMHEEQRSGTWFTVRRARALKRPVMLVYPDGSILKERWS